MYPTPWGLFSDSTSNLSEIHSLARVQRGYNIQRETSQSETRAAPWWPPNKSRTHWGVGCMICCLFLQEWCSF